MLRNFMVPIVLALAGVFVAAACSSDDGSNSPATARPSTNAASTTAAAQPGAELPPGAVAHVLPDLVRAVIAVVPTLNDHAEVLANEEQITIDYQPASPLKVITDAISSAKPSVKILEPKPGTSVSGEFDVRVQVSNYNLSCDLLGKADVAGYGHWHLNLDTTTGMMMGMATMLGMSCEQTFKASTAGLTPGSTHSVIALLTDDQHVPLEPEISDKVDVTIK